jgi:DNA-binding GntR family transcriptional regulator
MGAFQHMPGLQFNKSGIEIQPVSRETLQDQVYRQVTELIVNGSIIPGQMVTVQSLADAFKVSPMPVREALRRLTAENALTVVSGRSMGIPPLSRERLTDLRNVRVEVEATTAAWAAERVDETVLEVLKVHLETLEQADIASDSNSYVRANYAFHFTMYRAAGSPIMLHIIETLWLQISPYFHLLHDSGNYSTANQRHNEMFEALTKRDANSIRASIRADMDAAYETLLGLL